MHYTALLLSSEAMINKYISNVYFRICGICFKYLLCSTLRKMLINNVYSNKKFSFTYDIE